MRSCSRSRRHGHVVARSLRPLDRASGQHRRSCSPRSYRRHSRRCRTSDMAKCVDLQTGRDVKQVASGPCSGLPLLRACQMDPTKAQERQKTQAKPADGARGGKGQLLQKVLHFGPGDGRSCASRHSGRAPSDASLRDASFRPRRVGWRVRQRRREHSECGVQIMLASQIFCTQENGKHAPGTADAADADPQLTQGK